MKRILVSIAYLLVICFSCKQHSQNDFFKHPFADTPRKAIVVAGFIDEASGIADSRANPGHLWVEEDSGNPPKLSLLSYDGTFVKSIFIKGASNRDWEDLVLSKGPEAGSYYLYLAETGDNYLQFHKYCILRIEEPSASQDTITTYDKLFFRYPDGSNNAEAMLVDGESKDIYIITKSDVRTNIYKLPYPQSTDTINEAVLVGSLPLSVVVGAALSPDGSEIIVKTYTALYYWKRYPKETLEHALKRAESKLGYESEIQGEAVCFKNDNDGFFTLSEKPPLLGDISLNFYKRQ